MKPPEPTTPDTGSPTPVPAENAFVRGVERLGDWGKVLASAAVMVILALISLEVLARNVFNSSIIISEEMSGYLYAAIVFLGIGETLRRKAFIRVEAIYQRLRGRALLAVRWWIVLASMLYTALLLKDAVRQVMYLYTAGVRSDTVAQVPLYLPQSIVVIGWSLLLLQLLSYAVRNMRDLP